MSALRLGTPFSLPPSPITPPSPSLSFSPRRSDPLAFSPPVSLSSSPSPSSSPLPPPRPPRSFSLARPSLFFPPCCVPLARVRSIDLNFFSSLESGALRAISRLVAGWSSPRKTPRKIVRSICLRSSGPKRTGARERNDDRGIPCVRARRTERNREVPRTRE